MEFPLRKFLQSWIGDYSDDFGVPSRSLTELSAAAEYYERKEEGLGQRFRTEVLQVCQWILQQPVLWRERPGGYRRVNCPVFPYYIAYFIRDDRVVVAAVAHGHQQPEYWKARLK